MKDVFIDYLNMSLEEAIKEITNLNVEKRLLVVSQLWDTIAMENDKLPVSEVHKRILDERLKDRETGTFMTVDE